MKSGENMANTGLANSIKSFIMGESRSVKAFGNYGSVTINQNLDMGSERVSYDGHYYDEALNINPQLNSAVAICIQIGLNLFRNGSLRLYKPDGDGRTRVKRHPMANLIYRPNTLYPSKLMWAAIYVDYWLDGNAYLQIDREGTNTPKALYYLPTDKVKIISQNSFIDYYEYTGAKGIPKRIYPEDMIHFRHGIDKTNCRRGYAPIRSTLINIMGDQEAARFQAALLKNNAVPGVILIPTANDNTASVDPAKANILKRLFKAAFSGSNRGGVWVASKNMDVKIVGQSPKDLAIGDMNNTNEQRIVGAFQLPLQITPFNAGQKTSTYNNINEAHLMAYTSNVIPTGDDITDTLNYRLGEEFGVPDGEFFYAFDYSNIAVLQEDLAAKEKRMIDLVAGGIISVNEGRKELKMAEHEGEEYSKPIPISGAGSVDQAIKKQLEAENTKKNPPAKKAFELTEGIIEGEVVQ